MKVTVIDSKCMECGDKRHPLYEVAIPILNHRGEAKSYLCGACLQVLSNLIYSAKLERAND